MAKTKNGIVYPDNYDKVADVPADLKELAESVDEVIENNKTEMKKSNETRDGKISKNTENIEAIQGSIKTAIETINKKDNEQDEDIKANKESIEELKAENLEIKVENERLRNDIKSIALPGEASGENIHLEDSSDARCELEICGNRQQNTREGYNKLDSSEFINSTQNGVTLKVNLDGTLTLNGTATADTTFRILRTQKLIVGKENLKVIINQLENAIKTGTIRLVCQDKNYENTIYSQIGTSTFYNNLKEGITYNIFSLVVSSGTICNNLKLGLVISENKTDYEQYGASPSIDYPSQVKSVGDNVNYFDINSVTNTLIILESGNLYPNDSWRTTDFIEVKANIYTLSWESITNYFQCNIAFYDKDKKYLSYIQYANRTFSNTFDVKNNAKYMRISYSVKSGGTSFAREKIKLETGNKRTEYSSYNCGSAKIDIFNENIFPNLSNKSVSDRGITLSYDGNTKEFCAKGITTAKEFYCNISFKELKYLNANKSYIFSIDNPILQNIQMQLTKYGVLANAQIDTQKKSANITQLDKAKPNTILLYSNNIAIGTKIDWTFKVQIKEGTIATNYVQHEEQSYLVDVQQEMLEGDTFVRQDGKWYEKHCWKKMLLNGTEKVGVSGASTNEILAIVYDINNAVDGFGYSNYFLYSSQVELNKMSVYNGGKNLRVNVSKMQFADSEPFKAKLKELYEAGTPVIIYYKLAEPILLECTKAQSKVLDEIYNKAHTYKNITNILVESAEVNPIICLKYLKDPETEHNKLQTQIDEIKQLLSTTETSAMLLNNMQTDLESEV